MTEYRKYWCDVWVATYRSLEGMPRVRDHRVQTDHVVPISQCWKYRVPVEKAGGPGNLRFIPKQSNLQRGARLDEDARKKLKQWGYDV